MDTSSAAAECVTLQAAAGFNIHLFPTGQGNIVGNPIEPVVKLTANPLTVKGMGEHIDCDVSKILSREMNMSEAGDKLIETTLKVANGRSLMTIRGKVGKVHHIVFWGHING